MMRDGEITIEHTGSGNIDIIFCRGGTYVNHTVSWAEAEVMAGLLLDIAAKHKHSALNGHMCDVLNALTDKELDIAIDKGE